MTFVLGVSELNFEVDKSTVNSTVDELFDIVSKDLYRVCVRTYDLTHGLFLSREVESMKEVEPSSEVIEVISDSSQAYLSEGSKLYSNPSRSYLRPREGLKVFTHYKTDSTILQLKSLSRTCKKYNVKVRNSSNIVLDSLILKL